MSGDVREAKRKLPLPTLMYRLGLGQHAKKSARCPFHDDKHNSFSVWRNDTGLWFFKCHTGCGEGDEITFLEKNRNVSNSDATKLFVELAGVSGARPVQAFTHERSDKTGQTPLDWPACVDAFTDKHVEHVAKWRGFSPEFVREFRDARLIGIFNGLVAFPVHDRAGKVVAVHYRLKDAHGATIPQGRRCVRLS